MPRLIKAPLSTPGTSEPTTLWAFDPSARGGHIAIAKPQWGVLHLVDVVAWDRRTPPPARRPGVLLCEWPQDYDKFAVAKKDLDRLRASVRMLEAACKGQKYRVHPHTWKGTVPKPVHHQRVWDRLTEAERAVLGPPNGPDYDHNEYDAAGIFLWAVGRLRRAR